MKLAQGLILFVTFIFSSILSCNLVGEVSYEVFIENLFLKKHTVFYDKQLSEVCRLNHGGFSGEAIYYVKTTDEQEYCLKFGKRIKINQSTVVAASKIGITPKVHGIEPVDGNIECVIADFIHTDHKGILSFDACKNLATVLKKMHDLANNSEMNVEETRFFELVYERLDKVKNVLGDHSYAVCKNMIEKLQKLFCVHKERVLVHGDCHMMNILWHKDDPLLIDFDVRTGLGLASPFIDIANLAITHIFASVHEKVFLSAYFNREISSLEWEIFALCKRVCAISNGAFLVATAFSADDRLVLPRVPVIPLYLYLLHKVPFDTPADMLNLGLSFLQYALNN